MPLQDPPKIKHPNEQDPHTIDPDGFERVQGIRTPDRSPDGAPADPQAKQGNTGWLIVGAFAAVIVIALVAMVIFGPLIGLVTLVLLTALAVVGNPVIWASILRGRERGPEAEPDQR
jgi:uncharacterized membrane protein